VAGGDVGRGRSGEVGPGGVKGGAGVCHGWGLGGEGVLGLDRRLDLGEVSGWGR
jgi:hypothetical protein